MSNSCLITGKKKVFGNNVSNSNRRTRRCFMPNIRPFRSYSSVLQSFISLRRVSSAGIRTIEKNGGLDSYLINTPISALHKDLRSLRKRVLDAISSENSVSVA